jgi:SPP1 gp7 family putative phage head morphogenesis protein
MNSRDYWAKREAEALKHYITDEKEYDKRIKQIYSDMLDACQKEINGFYGKYAAKEGITIAEAKKRVSKLDIAAYERKAKRYVRDKDFSDKANEEMRLYNATMKINRLEMLKANIGLELIDGHEQLDKFMSDILKGRTEDELKRQAGILGKTVKSNAKKVDAIVNASFHNATFSDRVWQYQELMKSDLAKLLQTGLIQGKNPRLLARELKKAFDVRTSDAERLMRTELARVQTEAQKQSFERNGFEQYTFIVNGGCCPICEALKDKHFPVAKMMPGENAPPMHPHCRCSTAAYSDRADYEQWLQHLADGGTTEEWEALSAEDKAKHRQLLTKSSKSGTMSPEKEEDEKMYPKTLAGVDRGEPMSFEQANSGNTNPKYGEDYGYSINCQSCVVCNEARRRGYDVSTLPNKNNPTAKRLEQNTNLAWRDPSTGKNPEYITDRSKTYTPKSYKTYLESIIEKGNRYTIEFGWKGRGSSGHIVNIDRTDDGLLRIKDNQRGAGEKSEWKGDAEILRYLSRMRYSRSLYGINISTTPKVLRIDNMQFDLDVVEKILERREQQ